jgi:hypothetical protein
MSSNFVSSQLAKNLREVFFGGNWTFSNMKQHLEDVTWEQAIKKIKHFNTISTLVYHSGYYVDVLIKILNGEKLESKDEYSFMVPLIKNEEDWQSLIRTLFHNVEVASALLEKLPDSKLQETFVAEKYGNYYRNIAGIIEHTHYHLGQIVMVKKML